MRLWGQPEECEQTGSREAAVKKVWSNREDKVLMANDTAGAPGYAERAGAGHNVDRGSCWVAEEQSERKWWFGQCAGDGDPQLLADSPGESSNEHAGWE